jgi:hypothetical protein
MGFVGLGERRVRFGKLKQRMHGFSEEGLESSCIASRDTHAHTHTQTRTHAHTHAHTHTRTHAHTHTHTRTHTHAHTHTRTHAHTHTRTRARMRCKPLPATTSPGLPWPQDTGGLAGHPATFRCALYKVGFSFYCSKVGGRRRRRALSISRGACRQPSCASPLHRRTLASAAPPACLPARLTCLCFHPRPASQHQSRRVRLQAAGRPSQRPPYTRLAATAAYAGGAGGGCGSEQCCSVCMSVCV